MAGLALAVKNLPFGDTDAVALLTCALMTIWNQGPVRGFTCTNPELPMLYRLGAGDQPCRRPLGADRRGRRR